jgi:antitoxin component YwqK of YwqJK toxin-antitoxin module
MKSFFSLVLLFILVQCSESPSKNSESTVDNSMNEIELPKVVDSLEVLNKDLTLDQLKGVWSYNQKPFNGYAVNYYSDGSIKEKLGFINGKREGVAKRWSKNGVLRWQSHYEQNKFIGSFKTWWENGVLAEESTYEKGVLEGIQKQWYDSGQLAKLRRLVKGKENGMQQAWLKNGTLYINYEARNGRVFGLKRSNLCYQLEDEVVVRDNIVKK